MPSDYTIKTIAHIHSEFPDKFGIPRQSGLVADLRARILFEPEYQIAEAFKGLEDFSHISETAGHLLYVRPDSEEIYAWASLRPVPHSVQIPLASPA